MKFWGGGAPENKLLVGKRIGFTLAEVLITIGIIGIVAAMTMPALINNLQVRHFKSMFKKQYSIISQAIQMLYAEDGAPMDFANWRDMPLYVCRIAQKLNAEQSGLKCNEMLEEMDFQNFENYRNTKVSWHADNTWYNKKKQPQFMNNAYRGMTFYLMDGSWINFNCIRTIFVDVNGAKNPNTIGRDIFYLYLPAKSTNTGFFNGDANLNVNGCSGSNYYVTITKKNYKEDCENGFGWGCSPVYILD